MPFWQPFVFPNPIRFDQLINIMEILICTVVVPPSDPQLFDYTTVAQEYEGKEYFNWLIMENWMASGNEENKYNPSAHL